MKISLILTAALIAMPTSFSHAADSAANANIPSEKNLSVEGNSSSASANSIGLKKFEESSVITDAKLKADAGSLTVFSLKASMAYYGPPVNDLSAKDQPNPDNVVTPIKTAISGSIGARYRFDSNTSLSSGAGLKDQYPFREGQKFTMSNPFLSYDRSFRLNGWQLVASPGLTLVTEETYRNVGERWGVNAKLNGVYNLGESGFSVGSDNSLAYYFFDRDYRPSIPASKGQKAVRGDGAVQRISLSIAPNVKYSLTKKLAAITSWGFAFFNPRSESSRFEYRSRLVNQRLGLGYAISRDIYLNPYVQFYPTQFSWNTMTANISTVFSIL